MRKIFTLLLILTSFVSYSQNLLETKNPGFEDEDPNAAGAPHKWKKLNAAAVTQDLTVFNSGAASGKVEITTDGSYAGIQLNGKVDLTPGAYKLGVWVRGTVDNKVGLQIRVFTSDNVEGTAINKNVFIQSTDVWEFMEMEFEVTNDHPRVTPVVRNTNGSGAGVELKPVFYVDDISIASLTDNLDFEGAGINPWGPLFIHSQAPAGFSASAEQTAVAEEINNGTGALKVVVSGAEGDIAHTSITHAWQYDFNGTNKVITYWAKATAEVNGEVPVLIPSPKYYNASTSGGQYTGKVNLSSEYREYKWAFNMNFTKSGQDEVATTFSPQFRMGAISGTYFIDDVSLSDYVAPAINYTPVLSASVGQAYTDQAVKTIPNLGLWSVSGADWISIDAYTGEITGTPGAGANAVESIVVTLKDGVSTITKEYDITVNGGVPTAIDELTAEVSIYPNPMDSELQIATDAQVTKVEIYSLTGQRVLGDYTGSKQVNVASLSKGVYIVSVEADGQIIRKKITKQ